MADLINKLLSKKHKKGFLGNRILLKCESCGQTGKRTYYELFESVHFEVLEPAHVPIQNGVYEEEVPATPIKFKEKCPKCGNEMEAFSPVPMEYILNILQSTQPDEMMYG